MSYASKKKVSAASQCAEVCDVGLGSLSVKVEHDDQALFLVSCSITSRHSAHQPFLGCAAAGSIRNKRSHLSSGIEKRTRGVRRAKACPRTPALIRPDWPRRIGRHQSIELARSNTKRIERLPGAVAPSRGPRSRPELAPPATRPRPQALIDAVARSWAATAGNEGSGSKGSSASSTSCIRSSRGPRPASALGDIDMRAPQRRNLYTVGVRERIWHHR
jgi:hypothetical protein